MAAVEEVLQVDVLGEGDRMGLYLSCTLTQRAGIDVWVKRRALWSTTKQLDKEGFRAPFLCRISNTVSGRLCQEEAAA